MTSPSGPITPSDIKNKLGSIQGEAVEQVENAGLVDLGGVEDQGSGLGNGSGVGGTDGQSGQSGSGEQFFHVKTPVRNL